MTLCLVLCAKLAWAEGSPMTPGHLAHALDRLANSGRVLYLAAHPDDENTRLLAYLANARHVSAAYLSLTRGEGGQNLIGPEQGELLGMIRTQELLAARRLDGALQRFTRLRDFGYSKTAAEALETWDADEALHDVVWTLRRFQPDVVITRFNELPPNHGHHTASAILARQAVEAAADPKRFPEQLKDGITPWKVERLLHNHSSWRGPAPADALPLEVGGYDVRLGLSYGELSAESRSQHKSQGFGNAGERGSLLEHFIHVAGSKPKTDLLEGVDLGWRRWGPAAGPWLQALGEARRQLSRDEPEKAIPALIEAHRLLDALPPGPRIRDARASLEQLIASAAGLFVRATAPSGTLTPGSKTTLAVELVMRRPAGLKVLNIRFPFGVTSALGNRLGVNEKQVVSHEVTIPAEAPVSVPFWLPVLETGGRDQAKDLTTLGEPEGPAPLRCVVDFEVGGRTLTVERPVQFVWTDRVHGERVRRVELAPPGTVSPARKAVMLPNSRASTVGLRVRAHQDNLKAIVRLPLPEGWTASPREIAVALKKAGQEQTVHFDVKAPPRAAAVSVSPTLEADGREWSFREDVVDAPHIPWMTVFQKPVIRLSPLALQLPSGRVGYVEGSGDTVAEDLSHVGVQVELLSDSVLRQGRLEGFATIVLGIRALNTREVLKAVWPRLMHFVEKGGTLVVQYNTHSRFAGLDAEVGPYPLTLGQGRVTDQTAAMTPVTPLHPVLKGPNPWTPADAQGWVQERGLYFAETWDSRYAPVFKLADPGEEPQLGSVLVASHGKGRYLYTGLAFFRQLPAGVPGAYRLFANFIDRKRP